MASWRHKGREGEPSISERDRASRRSRQGASPSRMFPGDPFVDITGIDVYEHKPKTWQAFGIMLLVSLVLWALIFLAWAAVANAAVIYGNDADNYLYGTVDGDLINGLGGADNIYGQGGNDSLYGAEGRDYLKGQSGADYFSGGGADDTISSWGGSSGIDDVFCGGGDDLAIVGPLDFVHYSCESVVVNT